MHNQAHIGHNNPPTEIEILNQRLADNYTGIADRIDTLTAQAIPAIINDEAEAGRITDYIKSLNGVKKDVGEAHKREKAIYLDCGRIVDAWKNAHEARIGAQVQAATVPLQAFLDRKAAEERQRQLEIARKAREEAERLEAEANAHAAEGLADTAGELLEAAQLRDEKATAIEQGQFQSRAKARSSLGASAGQKLVWTGEIEALLAVDLEVLRPFFTEEAIQKAINAFVRDGGRVLRGVRIYQKSTILVR